jgi:23S rRNA (cytidine1920-2'-O)/16S rRNA (cytidine1409-2'-O)-methyltransferase
LAKVRADVLVHRRGLAPTRERARALILAGRVFTGPGGARRVEKAGDKLGEDAPLEVRGEDHGYVSRGGVKLEGALEDFGFDPSRLVVADFGASTGGFTDCLLKRGAARVYAIDVGYGQLHPTLRRDVRVVVMERVNARYLDATSLPELVDLVVIDASFIGLRKLLPAAHAVLAPAGSVLALVKPQFEVGRDRVGKGGVVRDPKARAEAIEAAGDAAQDAGFDLRGVRDAKLAGPKGNREAFLWLARREVE